MNENDFPRIDYDYDRNTASMCDRIGRHLFLKSTTYHDRSYDARCIKCGLNAHLERIDNKLEMINSW